jgi:hypothetical protein
MKLDWKREDKALYLPKNSPELMEVPSFSFFTVHGQGNPNDSFFGEYVAALYALSYAVKMSPKSNCAPEGYVEYSVYPLEGIWDLTEEGIRTYDGTLDKEKLAFTLMIRQPDFVTEDYAREIIERTRLKKPNPALGVARFIRLKEGSCVQMLHVGGYDDEPASFAAMEAFAKERGYKRASKTHREIYLSDPKKTAREKLKTVLRFKVEQIDLKEERWTSGQ